MVSIITFMQESDIHKIYQDTYYTGSIEFYYLYSGIPLLYLDRYNVR